VEAWVSGEVKDMENLRIVRMRPDDWLCWTLWPAFERRLRAVSPALAPETPVDALVKLLRSAFANDTLGHFVIVLVDMESHEVRGHLIAWVEQAWGKGVALIHQCATDFDVTRFYADAAPEFRQWIDAMNKVVSPPIDQIRWYTKRGEGWHERMKRHAAFDRSCLSMTVAQLEAAFLEISHGRG
jgi:hypothetical protein